MSTFDGLLAEFPDIRIDYFRSIPNQKSPAACFLSHVHSDHLTGLESLKMPFVYCSATTKKILLRMEKYPHRMNFQKGILEARKQTYRHLKLVLRALPLQTPVELELGPKTAIKVTLFDANHCPGAVMFLIEGDGRAILYTGDIRAENWWVNSIVKNPIMLPYTYGTHRLDCIYLDTTFASHDDIYKEFPSKADGLKELSTKVKQCPKGSRFYFRAWTLGYEDVWLTLSRCLNSRIHVDDYQLGLFGSIADQQHDNGPALVGVQIGNQVHPGCLTSNYETTIHSCEPGMKCHASLLTQPNTVWISPILSRSRDGTELAEIGAGGGKGDLYNTPQLEIGGEGSIAALRLFCNSLTGDEAQLGRIEKVIESLATSESSRLSLGGFGLDLDQEVSLKEFVRILSDQESTGLSHLVTDNSSEQVKKQQVIHFPYSRHSSYSELRHLVSTLSPRDICPCTVDIENWSEETSMESLFGDLCSGDEFHHDQKTRERVARFKEEKQQTRIRRRKAVDSESSLRRSQRLSNQDKSMGVVAIATNGSREEPEEPVDATRNEYTSREDADIVQKLTLDYPHGKSTNNPEDSDNLSDISMSLDAFGVYDYQPDTYALTAKQTDNPSESTQPEHVPHDVVNDSRSAERGRGHISSRIQAYRAAKAYLNNNDPEEWDGLRLRSMGWKGHTEEETVL